MLSFPPSVFGAGGGSFLGDIALAAETIAQEAEFQGKSFDTPRFALSGARLFASLWAMITRIRRRRG